MACVLHHARGTNPLSLSHRCHCECTVDRACVLHHARGTDPLPLSHRRYCDCSHSRSRVVYRTHMTLSALAEPTRTYAPQPFRPILALTRIANAADTSAPSNICHPPPHTSGHTTPYTHRMPATQRSHAGWRPTGKSARRRRQAGTQTCTTHTPGTLDAPGNATAFNSALPFGGRMPRHHPGRLPRPRDG